MQVDANVSESDIGGMVVGNKTTFKVDAFPARTFEGMVTQVRQSPQTVQNVVTYDVVIGVDNNDLALKPGMTAATRIVIDQRQSVTRVPNEALRFNPSGTASRRSGPSRVWILRDGEPVPTSVTSGLTDELFTELVQSDLKPGDRAIVGERRDGARPRASVPRPRL
jgi:HlyD family secretion protein